MTKDETYTPDLPTEPGYYWAKFGDGPDELVEIDEHDRVWEIGDDQPGHLANYEDYEWSGPIKPPAREAANTEERKHQFTWSSCGSGGVLICDVCGDCYCVPPWTKQAAMAHSVCNPKTEDEP